MAKTEEKTNDYRLERKKRLAKAAKTRKQGGADSTKIVSIIIYAICIVAVLALCCFGLYQFGVPQKVMPALKVGDKTYTVAEYSFYYTNVYHTYANSQNSLGIALFDSTKDPAAQTTTDEDGNTITYDELFRNQVKETLENADYYLKKAKADGITLSEDNKAAIDEEISELANYANQYGYSTSRYISVLYGKGLNEKKFRSLLENQFLVSQVATAEADSAATGTDAASATDAVAADQAAVEARGEKMLGRITDEASFIELAKEYCDEGDRETFESDTALLMKSISFFNMANPRLSVRSQIRFARFHFFNRITRRRTVFFIGIKEPRTFTQAAPGGKRFDANPPAKAQFFRRQGRFFGFKRHFFVFFSHYTPHHINRLQSNISGRYRVF